MTQRVAIRVEGDVATLHSAETGVTLQIPWPMPEQKASYGWWTPAVVGEGPDGVKLALWRWEWDTNPGQRADEPPRTPWQEQTDALDDRAERPEPEEPERDGDAE